MVHLVREGRGGQQDKAGGLAGAKLAAAAVKGDVPRTAGDPDQGKVPFGEVLQGVFAVGIGQDDVPPQVFCAEDGRVPQALAAALRQAAQQKLRHGDLFGQGLKVPDLLVTVSKARIGVGEAGPLRRVHARKLPEGGGIGLHEAETAHELKIVHLLPAHIVVGGAQHVRLGALEPGVEAHTQRHNGEDREKAAQRRADAPQEHFSGFGVHALTIRSLRSGLRGDSR